MKNYFSTFLLFVVVALLSSCSSNEAEVNYLAVKLADSEMWSIVDINSGKILYEDEFKEQPSPIFNDMFYIKTEDGKYNFYNVNNIKVPINKEPYKDVVSFNNDGTALAVLPGGAIQIINKNCEVITELDNEIESCGYLKNNVALVVKNNKVGVINQNGDFLIEPKYKVGYCKSFSDECIVVVREDEKNIDFFSKSGDVMFTLKSSECSGVGIFADGYCPISVQNGDSYDIYYVNKKGEKTKKIGKDDSDDLSKYRVNDGITIFKEGDLYGLKKIDGEIILRAKYDELELIPNGYYKAKKNNKCGIITKSDDVVLPFEYINLRPLNNNRIIIETDDVYSIVDYEGKDVLNRNIISYVISQDSKTFVNSNYFNATKKASTLLSLIDHSSCHGITKDKTLRDFKYLLTESVDYYASKFYINEKDEENNIQLNYGFKNGIVTDEYEYYYGYKYTTGKKFNYDSPITLVSMAFSTENYEESSGSKFVEIFENKLKNKGFTPINNNWFTSKDKENYVCVDYSDKVIAIYYSFENSVVENLKLDRNLENSSEDDESEDYESEDYELEE